MAAAGKTPELLVLVLNAGMGPADCAAALEGLKDSSKKISSHKAREYYWNVRELLCAGAGREGEEGRVF